MNELAKLSRIRTDLAKAMSLESILDIRDKAEAVRMYAKAAGYGRDVQNDAAEIKIEAEAKAGALLDKMGLSPGNPQWSHRGTIDHPTLDNLDITKNQSSRWQRIAKVPPDVRAEHIAKIRKTGEVTSAGILKLERKLRTVEPREPMPNDASIVSDLADLEGRKFGTMYADPPWAYSNQATRAATDNHYRTMSVEDIAALPVAELAADVCHLHLWTTNAFLFDAAGIIDAWGFEYKSCFVWVKTQMGIGNYWRVSHEFLLFGVRGAATFADHSLKSWAEFPRRKHSAKPVEVRTMVESASPGPHLELFGREAIPGWTVWGDEVGQLCLTSTSSNA